MGDGRSSRPRRRAREAAGYYGRRRQRGGVRRRARRGWLGPRAGPRGGSGGPAAAPEQGLWRPLPARQWRCSRSICRRGRRRHRYRSPPNVLRPRLTHPAPRWRRVWRRRRRSRRHTHRIVLPAAAAAAAAVAAAPTWGAAALALPPLSPVAQAAHTPHSLRADGPPQLPSRTPDWKGGWGAELGRVSFVGSQWGAGGQTADGEGQGTGGPSSRRLTGAPLRLAPSALPPAAAAALPCLNLRVSGQTWEGRNKKERGKNEKELNKERMTGNGKEHVAWNTRDFS